MSIIIGSVTDDATWERIPDASVHCVVTSPPYWALRDYGTATWEGGDAECDHVVSKANDRLMLGSDGKLGKNCTSWTHRDATPTSGDCPKCGARRADAQLGLEKTPEEYVENMVAVFRRVWDKLRDDGTLWLNIGDSYAAGGRGSSDAHRQKIGVATASAQVLGRKTAPPGLKGKDLVGIPWLLAFALRADGWYLRQEIIWHKPNPMPESTRDRCTKAHESIFLLTKRPRYYMDMEAIKEACTGNAHARGNGVNPKARAYKTGREKGRVKQNESFSAAASGLVTCRNKRSVWTVATQPYPGAHFATFPPKLIEPCILAGTSAKGVCPECGAPWERVVEKGDLVPISRNADKHPYPSPRQDKHDQGVARSTTHRSKCAYENRTTGWRPTCECGGEPVPATVLDPFLGAATTGVVAEWHGRNWVGIELNPEYAVQAEDRLAAERNPATWTKADAPTDAPLFAEVEP